MGKIFDYLNKVSIGSVSLYRILYIVFVLLISLIVVKILIRVTQRALSKSSHINNEIQKLLVRGVKFLLYFLFIIILCDMLGIKVGSFVALLSVVGAAFALAAQNVLSNLFDGLILVFNHPFRIGDYIESGGHAGTVVVTGLLYTKICTKDNKIINIPNSQLFADRIVNYSTASQRRVDIMMPASYRDDVEAVKAALIKAVRMTPGVLPDGEAKNPPIARLYQFGDSSMDYTVRVWCKSEDYWPVYFDLIENIKKVFDEAGLSIPFPQMDVHVSKNDP